MSEETLEISRPARNRSQRTRQHAQQHAPADAVLTQPFRCAIDLPFLAPSIPKTLIMSPSTQAIGCLTDSMLNLALLGNGMPGFELQQDKTFTQNVILAADYPLHQAIAPIQSSVKLRWWDSALSATEGTSPVEQGSENPYIQVDEEKHAGANAIIEFDLKQEGDVFHATTLLNSSVRLAQCESICPGFTHMLYTVLDCVSDTIWPIHTPRSLWNDTRFWPAGKIRA